MKEDIDEILVNCLNKEPLTDKEQRILEEWKNISAKNEKFGGIIQKLKQQKKILNKHQNQDIVFTKIQQHVLQTKKKRKLILWSSCAAGITLVFSCLFFLQQENISQKGNEKNQTYISGLSLARPDAELVLPNGQKRLHSQEKNTIIISDSNRDIRTDKQTLIVESSEQEIRDPEYYTMNVPFGAEYNVLLPDGTKIYLNAGSSLRYPDQFNGEKREVFLTGEAYFEVKSDSLHPFIVHAADVAIQVLGTAFNVNAYPEGRWIKTTLVEGRVEAQCKNNSFIMEAGTQVAYNKETEEAKYFPVNTQQFTSWKDGYYEFEEMPLEELMTIFTRWYNLNIEFADSKVKEIKFSGRLKRYEDLRSLFKMLEYTQDINFIMAEDRIIIQSK